MVEQDQTVISANTPSPGGTIPPGLHSQDLGQMLVGQSLGDFSLEEFVGGGGMGAVFRAVDTRLNRNVAVKVLSTHQSGDAEMTRRFQVEAQAAARLDHPHIARVHQVGEDRGLPYIVFEYIAGQNLRDLVGKNGPLQLEKALQFTSQIASALLHAWQRGVVHRDIKPSNILVDDNSNAKLVDMGLARSHHIEESDHDLTASGMTLGTFDYISPEQARNPKDADTRSDIYSLGCTLFFMLTARPPFTGGTALQKLLQHQGEEPPRVSDLRPELPEGVTGLLAKMLAKRADRRYQNPAELLGALLALFEELGISHHRTAIPSALQSVSAQTSGWRKHLPWIIPVILLLLGVASFEWFASGNADTAPFLEQEWPHSDAGIDNQMK